MKKITSKILIIALIITQLFLFVGCGKKAESETSFREDWLLNTYCYIKTFNKGEEEVLKGAFSLAREYENKLSKTIKDSLVYKLNSSGEDTGLFSGDEANTDLVTLIMLSNIFSTLSDGAFDITIGSLTDIWDFSSGQGKVPSQGSIENALKNVGLEKLWIDPKGEIKKANSEVKIDFGAIAKGYIADKVAEYLRENGVASAIISLGGNIVCVGEKPDLSPWQIGIEKPDLVTEDSKGINERETVGTVNCPNDYSVVTSGTYERYILDGDKVYHHIINPKTGYSAETDLVSATIIGEHSVVCDALSTCAILLGSDEGAKLIDAYNKVNGANNPYEYVLITDSGEMIYSTQIN